MDWLLPVPLLLIEIRLVVKLDEATFNSKAWVLGVGSAIALILPLQKRAHLQSRLNFALELEQRSQTCAAAKLAWQPLVSQNGAFKICS